MRVFKSGICLMLAVVFAFGIAISASAAGGNYSVTKYTLTGNQRTDIVGIARTQLDDMNGTKASVGATEYIDRLSYMSGAWCARFISWCAQQAKISNNIIKYSLRSNPESFGLAGSDALTGAKTYTYKNLKDGTYIPKAGDLIFFGSFSTYKQSSYQKPSGTFTYTDKDSESKTYGKKVTESNRYLHVGIIDRVYKSGSTYYFLTIEGNTSDPTGKYPNDWVVARKKRKFSNTTTGFLYYSLGKPFYFSGFAVPNYNQNANVDYFEENKEVFNRICEALTTVKVYSKPELTSALVETVEAGSKVLLVYRGHDVPGTAWYKTDSGYYVKGTNLLPLNQTPEIVYNEMQDYPLPSGEVVKGTNVPVKGSVSSDYYIDSVTVSVVRDGITVQSKTGTCFAKTVGFSKIGSYITTETLEAGDYELKIAITAGDFSASVSSAFTVLPLANGTTVDVSPATVQANEKSIVNFSAKDATHYSVKIEKDGNPVLNTNTDETYIEFVPTEAGSYKITVGAYNDYSETQAVAESTLEVYEYIYEDNGEDTLALCGVKGAVTSVNIPEKIGDKTVTEIKENAFFGQNKITSASIPGTVKKIGKNAFWGTSVKEFVFPEGLEEIGENAVPSDIIILADKGSLLYTFGKSNNNTVIRTDIADAVKHGDINEDGDITLLDAMTAFKIIANAKKLPTDSFAMNTLDVTYDGVFSLADAMRIFKYVSKEIDTLEPIWEPQEESTEE